MPAHSLAMLGGCGQVSEGHLNPKTVCTMLGKGYNKLETIIIIVEQHLVNMRLSKMFAQSQKGRWSLHT